MGDCPLYPLKASTPGCSAAPHGSQVSEDEPLSGQSGQGDTGRSDYHSCHVMPIPHSWALSNRRQKIVLSATNLFQGNAIGKRGLGKERCQTWTVSTAIKPLP